VVRVSDDQRPRFREALRDLPRPSEVAGLTISIWYPQAEQTPAVELEPIGPRNDLAPDASAAFTEHWWVLENPFPKPGEMLDLRGLAATITSQTR
jgi:hypothetical protein